MEPRSGTHRKIKPRCIVNYSTSRRPAIDAYARSSITKFFNKGAIGTVLKLEDAGKYAFGYAALDMLDEKRKNKPKTKGDRYHTKEFGQALRYGQYAVIAVCTNRAGKKSEVQALEAVLSQWIKFEKWAEQLSTNAKYKTGTSFDYISYYKGSTINADLQAYAFSV